MRPQQGTTLRCFALLPLMILLSSVAIAQQTRPIENMLKENSWVKGHHYVLRLTSDPSVALGELRMLEDSSTHEYSKTPCFQGLPINKPTPQYMVFQETFQVWKRSKLGAVLETITAKVHFPRPTKESGGGMRPDIEVVLTASRDAASIIATLSFTGTREDVDSQTVRDYALNRHWSDDCLSAVRAKNSFLVTDIIRGSLKLRFAQVIEGVAKPIDYVLASDWKKTGEGDMLGYETDAILVIARHLKIKTNGSRVTWLLVTTTYLPTLD
jgi:hypothetical protein